jgi:hypothetical protein
MNIFFVRKRKYQVVNFWELLLFSILVGSKLLEMVKETIILLKLYYAINQ